MFLFLKILNLSVHPRSATKRTLELAKRLELFEPHKFLPHLLHYYLEIAEEEAGDDEAGLYGGERAVYFFSLSISVFQVTL